MTKRMRWVAGTGAAVMLTLAACTGGQETNAAEERAPGKNPVVESPAAAQGAVNVERTLGAISDAIPLYAGARYRDDLTRRDEVMLRNQYGPQTEVYTLATNDSYPQVYHYYTTYLGQYRAFAPPAPYPPENQNWRTLEVPLNEAMQDPFIPGESLPRGSRRVILQIAETEAEPTTVIRYIVTAPAPAPTATASK